MCHVYHLYSGPSLSMLSGHSSREATLSNKEINLCRYYYRMHLLLPLTKGYMYLSNVATNSWQIGWPY